MDDMDARKAENLARTKWNEEADEFNQWSELGQDEKDKLIDAVFCDKSKFYCENPDCNNEIEEPLMCCDGRECGCMGLPTDPPVYSQECYDKIYGNKNVSHET